VIRRLKEVLAHRVIDRRVPSSAGQAITAGLVDELRLLAPVPPARDRLASGQASPSRQASHAKLQLNDTRTFAKRLRLPQLPPSGLTRPACGVAAPIRCSAQGAFQRRRGRLCHLTSATMAACERALRRGPWASSRARFRRQ